MLAAVATTASRRLALSTACRGAVNLYVPSASSSAAVAHLQQCRKMSSDDLPYHLVVGMPALSPTMEAGTIAEWNLAEGDSFIAGDSLAEIETDKATIAFEAQDDGYVARLLVPAGGDEIKVGTPVMITVEEEEDVAAFKDYVPEAAPEEAAPAAAEEKAAPEPAPAVVEAAAPPTPPPAAAVPVAAPPAPAAAAPPAEPVAPPTTPAPAVAAAADVSTVGPVWGGLARVTSPIAKTLSAEQKAYIEKYGSTGQIPL